MIKTIVTTNGCFDILHAGHLDFLYRCSQLGSSLIVLLNSDESIQQNKGDKRPVNNYIDRHKMLSYIPYIDMIMLFDEKDPCKILNRIKPDIHVKGNDYTMDQIIEKDVVEKNGGRIELIPLLEGYSTTKIIEKILEVYK